MKPLIFIALLAIFNVLAGCSQKPVKVSPLAGILGNADETSQGIDSAYASNEELRRLHYESLGLVDQLDYKTTILLQP